MNEILETVTGLSLLVFVIGSMASMGLSLKIPQILAPLRNYRLVILALVGNFILVPLVAVVITMVIPLADPIRIGLILLATAAGSPMLPKLADLAKGSTAFSVGLMILLMVVTIIYLPIVLPLLLREVELSPWEIAQSLIVMMLIPLGIGLFVNARYEDAAAKIQPTFGMASNIALLTLTGAGVALNFKDMVALIGSRGILAGTIFIVVSLVIGYLLGGSDGGTRRVMGLSSAQRNISAALVVGGRNFDFDVVTYVVLIAVISLVILMPAASALGKRSKDEEITQFEVMEKAINREIR